MQNIDLEAISFDLLASLGMGASLKGGSLIEGFHGNPQQ